MITLEKRLSAFAETGKSLCRVAHSLSTNQIPEDFTEAESRMHTQAIDASYMNPWFTMPHVAQAIASLGEMLEQAKLSKWVEGYPQLKNTPREIRQIAVVMAGNIPLVGFHDFLCVLLSGHSVLGKLSSQDKILPVALAQLLIEKEPDFSSRIAFSEGPIKGFDAIIATGSNNSARYFEYYFGKYPNIIRKNRSSVAILDGTEDISILEKLGADVFTHFGLGCRNVSKILLPKGFDPARLFNAWQKWQQITDNYKYYNNYDYFKAVYLINRTPFFDSEFVLLKESADLSSPVAVLHYQTYESLDELMQYLESESENIQCVVSQMDIPIAFRVPPGKSQAPELWDYADRIDTMEFLLQLGN